MGKLLFAAALVLIALASSQAQNIPPGQNSSVPDNNRDALIIRDPVKRDEALIAGANRRGNSLEKDDSDKGRRYSYDQMFKARVEVMNNSAKVIKSVTWSASLIDSSTGQLIRAYDITTKTRIAPGRSKKLSKSLSTPRANIVSAGTPRTSNAPAVADLKTKITLVTYEDGSTSETP